MLKVNDVVLYSTFGACRVRAFCKRKLGETEGDYAVLETQDNPRTTIYLPLSNPVLMSRVHPVPSAGELLSALHALPDGAGDWVENQDARRQHCRQDLNSGDSIRLLGMVHSLLSYRLRRTRAGKKLPSTDEQLLREARRLLDGELSFVLGIPREEVPDFVARHRLAPQ